MTITASDFNVTNANPEDIANLNSALQYLQRSSLASTILQQLVSNGVTIQIDHDGKNQYSPPSSGKAPSITWDPKVGMVVLDNNGNMSGTVSAALALIHEAAHATDPNLATDGTRDRQYGNGSERYAVGIENQVASVLGETQRFNHAGIVVIEPNSTDAATQDTPCGVIVSAHGSLSDRRLPGI